MNLTLNDYKTNVKYETQRKCSWNCETVEQYLYQHRELFSWHITQLDNFSYINAPFYLYEYKF